MAEDSINAKSVEIGAAANDDVEKKAASETILKHGLDADEALKAFVGHDGERLVLDEATNKRILRKIDMNILPVRSWCLHTASTLLTVLRFFA